MKSARGQTDDAPALALSAAGATPADPPAAGGNTQPGAAIQPTFNPAVPAGAQPTPTLWTTTHAATTAEPAVPVANLPVEIAARVEAGQKHFEIRLDPPSLGRIDVQLSVDGSGRATSHLVADRADTLDLLRRDAPALERALQSAGLTTDDGALQFSLRDQSFAGRDQGAPAPLSPPVQPAVPDAAVAPVDAALRRYGQLMGLGGGIDIRV
jgi:chemotaxis protein MotD